MFAGLKPRVSLSIREPDSRTFASLDAATDTELARRFGRFHKSQRKRVECSELMKYQARPQCTVPVRGFTAEDARGLKLIMFTSQVEVCRESDRVFFSWSLAHGRGSIQGSGVSIRNPRNRLPLVPML